MQDISAEWIENQNARIRKQGFVNISIETPSGGTITISSLDTTGRGIKQITHKRSYDPMSLTIPQNTLTIELFNYDGAYDDFYKTYNYQNLQIVIQYGFCLSETEVIAGGTFKIDDVSLADDILTIEAMSNFQTQKDYAYYPTLKQQVLYNSTTGGSSYTETVTGTGSRLHFKLSESDIAENTNITTGELITDIVSTTGIALSNGTAETTATVPAIETGSFKIGEIILSFTEAFGYRLTIDRDDKLVMSKGGVAPLRFIKQLDMLETPTYTRSKTVSEFAVDTTESKEAGAKTFFAYNDDFEKHGTAVDGSAWGLTTAYKYIMKIEDITKYSIVYVDTWSETGSTEGYIGRIYEVIRDDTTGFVTVISEYAGSLQTKIEIGLTERRVSTSLTIAATGEGLECDISNQLIVPQDLEAVKTYYSNRDVYDLSLRGDPSIDAGDYVWLSLTDDDDFTTYKTALVLESDLTFDGSFKDTMKVRIIDNDFETITGNTHADLTGYTHAQLSAYTHKQLMTEAI